MDGITAVKLIREWEQNTARARTPTIALTANAMPSQQADYLAAGMDGFVAKPINRTLLIAAIDEALALVVSNRAQNPT